MKITDSILILFSFIYIACNSNKEVELKKDVVNRKTPSHKYLSGTRISIIPPPRFFPQQSNSGYRKDWADAGIGIVEWVNYGFANYAIDFTKEKLAQEDSVISFLETTFNGYQARWAILDGSGGYRSIRLLFGDSTFAVHVKGNWKKTDKETGKDILKSIESVLYEKDHPLNPFEESAFYIEENNSTFKYFTSINGLIFYTVDGKQSRLDNNFLMVSQYSNAKRTSKELAEKAFPDDAELEFEKTKEQHIFINGLDAYEIEAIVKKKEGAELKYYCAFAGEGLNIVISGNAIKDQARYLEAFRTFSKAVKMK